MPSPFPGMNPYLEQDDVWQDFHERFLPLLAESILPHVRPKYIVKLDEHLYLHEFSAEERRFIGRPDVAIAEREATETSSVTTSVEAPNYGTVTVAIDEHTESFIEIRDRQSRELVTVIELLSPTNKRPGSDREQFLRKRRELLRSTVHYVEIDLLRGGPRLPIEDLPDCDYYVMVSQAEARPRVGLWPIGLRETLPEIPIPLKVPDPPARINLQAVLHRVYDGAGYEDYIYAGPPSAELSAGDAEWARGLLASNA